MTIKRNHPAREQIAALSSGHYYNTKAECIDAVDSALRRHGFYLDDQADYSGDEGSSLVEFWDSPNCSHVNDPAGYVHFSWYRLSTNGYEFIVYVT